MFIIFDQAKQRVPIYVWLPRKSDLDDLCLEQALNLSNLPCAFKHIALMPDTHTGYGMPIGGVLASKEAIVPNAVGVDIGCGMGFVQTDVPASLLRKIKTPQGSLAHDLVGKIMRAVPQGFDHHKQRQNSAFLANYPVQNLYQYGNKNLPSLAEADQQIGTLGGGNHFIELQEDSAGNLGIMVHTGSRNVGYKVANYFNRLAIELTKPPHYDLAYLLLGTLEAEGYLGWMNFALAFAEENRRLIMERVQKIVFAGLKEFAGITDPKITLQVTAHHNYATLEEHFSEQVWVHRKGAIRALPGELAIIPGAMGSYSYIVEGLGNPLAFNSASHGAGRVMGRKEAVRQFSVAEVLTDFAEKEIVLGKQRRSDTAEEYYKAYKDIEEVLQDQEDLVKPVLKLVTVAVVKG